MRHTKIISFAIQKNKFQKDIIVTLPKNKNEAAV